MGPESVRSSQTTSLFPVTTFYFHLFLCVLKCLFFIFPFCHLSQHSAQTNTHISNICMFKFSPFFKRQQTWYFFLKPFPFTPSEHCFCFPFGLLQHPIFLIDTYYWILQICVCMCVYTHTHTHSHTYIHMYIYIYTYIFFFTSQCCVVVRDRDMSLYPQHL